MDNLKEPEKGLIPEIKIAKIPAMQVFPMYLHELNELATGTPIPIFLNFSIFFLSLSGSLLGSVLLPISQIGFKNANSTLIILFFVGSVVFLTGLILLLVWMVRSRKVKKLAEEIKKRMPASTTNNK